MGRRFSCHHLERLHVESLKEKPKKDFPEPKEKPDFKKLTGKFVLYSGGDAPSTHDDAYGNTGRTATSPGSGSNDSND